MQTKDGKPNLKRYIASLDYSLDQIKLRSIYEGVCRRRDFSFNVGWKGYCNKVINVTFKYSVAAYNKKGKDIYIKYGAYERDIPWEDNAWVEDGQLKGIMLERPVEEPLPLEVLAPYFEYAIDEKTEKLVYRLAKNPKTIVSTAALREELYEHGFMCGGVKYIRWKRSAGSSRVGKCLFIDERLYPRMHKWETCGLGIKPGQEIDLAAFESYISLTSSSIVGLLGLRPENILVIDDYESKFTDRIISVHEDGDQLAANEEEQEISNSIWDGQGLIDVSALGPFADKGMVLLRNRFFKCCAFNTNLQKWFKNNQIYEISQLKGRTLAKKVEEIKLITTPSSIKYLKFGSLDDWFKNLEPTFGVVKYDKKTHFFDGEMVQTHYQLLNSLQMTREEVQEFLQPTLDYMALIKSDPAVLRYHIKYPIEEEMDITPLHSKNDVVFKLLGINDAFAKTKLYYDFRTDLLKSMRKNVRLGRILVDGNYSTLLGNPLEMLRAAIGTFDGTTSLAPGTVYSKRFAPGEELVASRSPHISMSNVWVVINTDHEELNEYFNMTPEIIAINSIGDNVLNRLSGSDFDSDTVMLTNNYMLVRAARKNENKYPIAMNNVESVKRKRQYTSQQMCDLDIKTGNNLIGDIINLSQQLNSLLWDIVNKGGTYEDIYEIYLDICILNVMSSIEIDSAKKEFNISNSKELVRLRKKYSMKDEADRLIKPNFFAAKDRGKGYYDNKKNNYKFHLTTMDYVQNCVNKQFSRSKVEFISFFDMVDKTGWNVHNVTMSQVHKVFRLTEELITETRLINHAYADNPDAVRQLTYQLRQDTVERIGKIAFSRNTMIYLLRAIEQDEHANIRRFLLNLLFGYPNTSFFDVLHSSREPLAEIIPNPDGDIVIFGKRYRKTTETSSKLPTTMD